MPDTNTMEPTLTSESAAIRGKRSVEDLLSKRTIGLVIISFVALGLLLRTVRYGLCFPLYGDEGSLAANFLDRDFAGLFRPLDYGQIAPLGFLWVELFVVKLMGFCEYTLRFIPYIASIASVGLFAMLAQRFCGNTIAAALAVAVFSVSHVLIRYAAEVKPYSIDLFVSILILTLALRVIERKDLYLLWYMSLIVPIAVLFSLPALFVIAGVMLTLGVQFILDRDTRLLLPSAGLALSTFVSFAVYYAFFLSPHHEFHKEGMTTFWAGAFPPIDNPFHLVWWFVDIHTGRLMAYPAGDKNGSSAISFFFFVMGAITLWKADRRSALLLMLSPFLMTFGAALLHRYPYGGSARIVQHLAPIVCLFVGIGINRMIQWFAQPAERMRGWSASLAALALLGMGFAVADSVRPYIEKVDPKTRNFCRDFWKEQSDNTALVVLTSFDHDRTTGILHREATWRCYQHIFAPHSVFCSTPPSLTESPERFEKVVIHLAANDLIDEKRLERAENWVEHFTDDHAGTKRDDLSLQSENQLHNERVHVVTLHPSTPSTGSLGQDAKGRTYRR